MKTITLDDTTAATVADLIREHVDGIRSGSIVYGGPGVNLDVYATLTDVAEKLEA